MIVLAGLCDKSGSMMVFLFLKILIGTICVCVPLMIIFRAISALTSYVMNGKDLKEHVGGIVKSIVAGLIVFLIPEFLNFTFTKVVKGDYGSITTCYSTASLEKVNSLRQKEAEEKKRLKEEEKKRSEQQLKEYEKEQEAQRKATRAFLEKYKKEHPEIVDGTAGSPGTSGKILKSSSNNIIIGDSRTVGMCGTVAAGVSGCSFSNGGPAYSGNDIYISQSAMGYSWFESTAIPTVNAIIQKNPNVTYNIFSLMGVNYLLSDLDKYIVKYNELSSGAWSKHNIILVSVNPVNEAIEAQHGYSTKNVNIISFNNQLKVGTSGKPNIKYCDTFNLINGNFQTGDGLHYSGGTYKDIYNGMMNCVR